MILIDALNEARLAAHPNEHHACGCEGGFGVEGLRPEFVREGALQQFVTGLFCQECDIGFVPDDMAKPPMARWVLSAEGWHEVAPDGSLGPPKPRAG